MKKRNKTLLALLTMVVFSLIVFVPVYSSEGFQNATPTHLQGRIPTIHPASLPSVSRDAMKKYASAEIETQIRNDVEMSTSNFRVEGMYLKVNVCFGSPSNKEWMIGEGFAQVGDKEILLLGSDALEISRTLDDGRGETHVVSGLNISVRKSDFSVPNYRCDTLLFVAPETLEVLSTVFLTVKSIHALPREETGCIEYHEAVQRILDQKKVGIRVECNQINGKAEFVIIENSGSMTEEEARNIVSAAYLESFTINGPWVFTGVVSAPEIGPTDTPSPEPSEIPSLTETPTEIPTETPIPAETPAP